MGKQWSADIQITCQLVCELLSIQFPDLEDCQIRHLAKGWDNELFEINDELIFRFPRREIAVDLISMENRLLPVLAPTLPLPIPDPIYIGRPTRAFPYPFSGYRKLQGSEPFKLPLTSRTRSQSAELWAHFLKTLHGTNMLDAIKWGAKSEDEIGRMNVGKRKPLYIERVREARDKGLIDEPDTLLQITRRLPQNCEVSTHPRCLVHGDVNFRNFLVDKTGGLSAVLDWGDAHIGHPAVDLSIVYSFLPKSARSRFYSVYGPVSPQTAVLARFRALYTNLIILLYANDIGDTFQFAEAKRALRLACEF